MVVSALSLLPSLHAIPVGVPMAEESTGMVVLLATLAIVLVATNVLGVASQRIGQPAVLGELIAGILLGPSLVGILRPDEVMSAFAELGVLVLLFQIGLHTNLGAIVKVGASAATVGLVGVAIPFILGILAMGALDVHGITAVVAGAALTATSIGISARVLSDIGRLDTQEGRIVLGAAVLDDVVGLIILSVVAGLAGGEALSAVGIAKTSAVAIGFLIAALVLGGLTIPRIFRAVGRLRIAGTVGALSLAFALALAAGAAAAGSAMIIGAFAAGLILHPTPQRREIEKAATAVGHIFVPIFFAVVGAAVNLHALMSPRGALIGAALVAVGIVGKLASGYAPFWFRGDKLMIGVAMIPRGEVGLIFAEMGRSTGALDEALFSAVLLMVIATTFVAPPWLASLARRQGERPQEIDRRGLDELVSGPQARRSRRRSTDFPPGT